MNNKFEKIKEYVKAVEKLEDETYDLKLKIINYLSFIEGGLDYLQTSFNYLAKKGKGESFSEENLFIKSILTGNGENLNEQLVQVDAKCRFLGKEFKLAEGCFVCEKNEDKSMPLMGIDSLIILLMQKSVLKSVELLKHYKEKYEYYITDVEYFEMFERLFKNHNTDAYGYFDEFIKQDSGYKTDVTSFIDEFLEFYQNYKRNPEKYIEEYRKELLDKKRKELDGKIQEKEDSLKSCTSKLEYIRQRKDEIGDIKSSIISRVFRKNTLHEKEHLDRNERDLLQERGFLQAEYDMLVKNRSSESYKEEVEKFISNEVINLQKFVIWISEVKESQNNVTGRYNSIGSYVEGMLKFYSELENKIQEFNREEAVLGDIFVSLINDESFVEELRHMSNNENGELENMSDEDKYLLMQIMYELKRMKTKGEFLKENLRTDDREVFYFADR